MLRRNVLSIFPFFITLEIIKIVSNNDYVHYLEDVCVKKYIMRVNNENVSEKKLADFLVSEFTKMFSAATMIL